MDKQSSSGIPYYDDVIDEEDDEALEDQEDFEHEYNFRFENQEQTSNQMFVFFIYIFLAYLFHPEKYQHFLGKLMTH